MKSKSARLENRLLSNRNDNRTNFGLFHISQDELDLDCEGLALVEEARRKRALHSAHAHPNEGLRELELV